MVMMPDRITSQSLLYDRLLVAKEMPLEIEDLPEGCPYGLEDTIDDAFFPE